tara:strand:- start:148 stop:315 length:168 start_codon:yes stop_codon:yes gene_type:complete
MGLSKGLLVVIALISIFFLFAFLLTSKNMDVEGLLITLYGEDWPGKRFWKRNNNN